MKFSNTSEEMASQKLLLSTYSSSYAALVCRTDRLLLPGNTHGVGASRAHNGPKQVMACLCCCFTFVAVILLSAVESLILTLITGYGIFVHTHISHKLVCMNI